MKVSQRVGASSTELVVTMWGTAMMLTRRLPEAHDRLASLIGLFVGPMCSRERTRMCADLRAELFGMELSWTVDLAVCTLLEVMQSPTTTEDTRRDLLRLLCVRDPATQPLMALL